MGRGTDTVISLVGGGLGIVVIYLAIFGSLNFALPPTWVSGTCVLLLAATSVGADPIISGNIILDSLFLGSIIYLIGVVLISGGWYLLFYPPEFQNLVIGGLVIALFLRGYLWSEEEVTLDI